MIEVCFVVIDRVYLVLLCEYFVDFCVDDSYKVSLFDLQNGLVSLIVGVNILIQYVGILNFWLLLCYCKFDGGEMLLEISVIGIVSFEVDCKGINMSCIMWLFYVYVDKQFFMGVLEVVFEDYKVDLDSFDVCIQMCLLYLMQVVLLCLGLMGWQYYDIVLELVECVGQWLWIMYFDYVYFLICLCLLEFLEYVWQMCG